MARSGSASRITLLGSGGPDVRTRRPNLAKARTLLGYQPRVTVAEGIVKLLPVRTQT
ncbi:hypothetical protein [Streptomyces sp. C10]|uniref:hypothetical protein n=1 Tax=Streptomyces sp. C10 TaxID=531941 RepID=UPI00397F0C6C